MVIILSVILGIIAFFGSSFIRKYFNYILVLTIAVSLIPLFFFVPILEEYIVCGFLGLAVYIIVMIAGGFKKNSKISKKFRSVRKEYSILGFILLIPHFYIYLSAYIKGSIPWELFGVIAMVIMIPLFITSFTIFKKKMQIKKWYKLQKFAYAVYLLIFIHLIVTGSGDHTLEYVLIFSFYTLLKLINYVLAKNNTAVLFMTKVAYIVGITVFGVYWVINNQLISFGDDSNTSEIALIGEESDSTLENLNNGPISLPDGDYSGSAYGYKTLIVNVIVSVADGYITNISLVSSGSTEPERGVDFEQAALVVISEIMSSQTTSVDSVAGATHTSDGVMDAVYDALH